MPEPAAAEVHADPDRVRLVGEDVDVVIAAADRAELRARLARAALRVRAPAAHPTPSLSNSG